MKENLQNLFKTALIAVLLTTAFSCKKEMPTDSLNSETEGAIKKPVKVESAGDSVFDVLGYGYNVIGEYANSNAATYKVININALFTDYPNRVETDLSKLQEGSVLTGENSETYTKGLTAKFSLSWGPDPTKALFKNTLTANFADSSWGDTKYIYGSYFLKIKQKRVKFNASIELLKNYLTPEFLLDIQNQSPSYIVSHYGTHVLTDISLGAKLEILYKSETTNDSRKTAAEIGLDTKVAGIFNLTTGLNTNSSSVSHNFSQTLHYKTYGGDPSISLVGTFALDNTAPVVNITNWQASSTVENAELIDIDANGLVPIFEFVADPAKKAALQTFVNQYLTDNQVKLLNTTAQLYRCYNSQNGDRLLTKDPSGLQGLSGWQVEGPFAKVYRSNFQSGLVPLYGFYLNSGLHLYSLNRYEVISNGVYEGIVGYVNSTQVPGSIPLYRYYMPTGEHMFAVNYNELGSGINGWIYEGILGYVLP